MSTGAEVPSRVFPATSQFSPDTSALEARLEKLGPGEVVPYSELTELIGRDVQRGARGNLSAAMRRLEKKGAMCVCLRRVGVMRLTDATLATDYGERGVAKIRRMAKRTARRVAMADDASLTGEDRARRNVTVSQCGALALAAGKSARTALQAANATGVVPAGKVLELMRK